MPYDSADIEKQHQTAKDSAYLLTMPLISSSLIMNEDLFSHIREDFLKHFMLDAYALMKAEVDYPAIISKIMTKSDKDTYFNTWLWGRYLVAANTVSPDSNESRHLKHILKQLLERDCRALDKSALPFYVWAKAYLLSTLHNDAEYQAYQRALQNDIAFQIENSDDIENSLWSLVMAFSAAGTRHDKDFFDSLKQQLCQLTKKDNIIDALDMIPPGSSGYRIWAFALVQQAGCQLNDELVTSEINAVWDRLIGNKDETTYGKTLASLIHEKTLSLTPKPF